MTAEEMKKQEQRAEAELRTMQDFAIRDIHDALLRGQGYRDMFPREVKAMARPIQKEYRRRFGNEQQHKTNIRASMSSSGARPQNNVADRLRKHPDSVIRGLYEAAMAGAGYGDEGPAEIASVKMQIVAEHHRRFGRSDASGFSAKVGPMNFRGLGYYSESDYLDGLSYSTEDAVLFGLQGFGQINQSNPSAMTSIIKANSVMQASVKQANEKKINAAKGNSALAAKLRADAARKSVPGTNTQSAIIKTMKSASMEAFKALQRRQEAARKLKQGDRQAAAAATISFMQHSRKALTEANRAEKTRLAIGADRTAATLEAQATFIESAARKQIQSSGRSGDTDRDMALVAMLRAKAARLRGQSASIAKLPDVPSKAPNQQRMADLANKYNIRTAMQDKFDDRRALMSVLSDVSNSAMAQVTDYEGAVSYYGDDLAGRLIADVEYGNIPSFLQGLAAMDAYYGLGQAADEQKKTDAKSSEGGGLDSFFKAVGSGVKILSDTSKMINDGAKAAEQAKNAVSRAGAAVGIKPPAKAANVSKFLPKAAPKASPAAPAASTAPAAAGKAARVVVTEQPVAAPQAPAQRTPAQQPAAAAAEGSNMPLILGVGGAALVAAVFVIPKLMRKSAAA